MNLTFRFPADLKEDTLEELTAYLQEQNLAGMMISRPEAESDPRSMSPADYLPIIEIVAGSTVAATAVKGLFDLIKKGLDFHTANKDRQAKQETAEFEAQKIDCTITKSDGSKFDISFHPKNEADRNNFLLFVTEAWQK